MYCSGNVLVFCTECGRQQIVEVGIVVLFYLIQRISFGFPRLFILVFSKYKTFLILPVS